jgi:hypothetical protein
MVRQLGGAFRQVGEIPGCIDQTRVSNRNTPHQGVKFFSSIEQA